MGKDGWHFEEPEPLNNAKYLKEVYHMVEPEFTGRYTVPILFDKKLKTIVNNESSEIIRMLNSEFDEFSSSPGLTFYPTGLASQIDELNSWIYTDINNGVYKSGFATTQEAYETSCVSLFNALDRVESILSVNEFLTGSQFTEADIRLWVTILRFDPVYHGHFKCNLKSIEGSYPRILAWTRRIYQMPKVAQTVNMEHIKKHYYMSHIQINPYQVVPLSNGPDLTIVENNQK